MSYSSIYIDSTNSNLRLIGNRIVFETWNDKKAQVVTQDAIGSPTMTVLGTRVGIGAATPGYTLDVAGDINFTGNLYKNNTPFTISSGSGGAWSNAVGTVYLDKGTSVGIGTYDTLGYDLNVNGSILTSNIVVSGQYFMGADSYNIRNALQVSPAKSSFVVTASNQDTFLLTKDGVFTTTPQTSDVYVNGIKLGYSNELVNDYTVTWSFVESSNTVFTVVLTTPAEYGDVVDIVIWPSFLSTQASNMPGYIYQQVNNSVWLPSGDDAYFTGAGNVGIGSTTPVTKLDINGRITTTTGINITTGNPGDLISKRYGVANRYGLGQHTNGTLRLFISNTYTPASCRISRTLDDQNASGSAAFADLVTVTYNGNMGVGTVNPSAKLDVIGTGKFTVDGASVNATPVTTNAEASIAFYQTSAMTGVTWKAGQAVYSSGANNFAIGNSSTGNTFTVLLNGNVGVGTTIPAYRFDVSGVARMQNILYMNDQLQNCMLCLWRGGVPTSTDTNYFGFGVNTNILRYQVPGTTADHVFYASNTELMRIRGNGTTSLNGIVSLPGGATISAYLSGTWINMPNTGASAIGSGGAGNNPWIGYASKIGEYFGDATAGDVCYRNTSGRMLFGNSGGIHNMAITSTATYVRGNVGIGTTNPTSQLDVNRFLTVTYAANTAPAVDARNVVIQNSNVSTSAGLFTSLSFQLSPNNTFGAGGRALCDERFVRKTAATSEASLIWGACNSAGTAYQDVMELNTNSGDLIIRGNLTTLSTFSDARLKLGVSNIDPCLEKVATLRPVEYTWDERIGVGSAKRDVGLIAQEVADVFPLVVTSANNLADGNEYLGIKYERLVPYLIKSIQELRQEVRDIRRFVDEAVRKI